MKSLLSINGISGAGFDQVGRPAMSMSDLKHARRRMNLDAGFTLVELMIVVGIIAILTAIAYPSYMRYVGKTDRVAAEACLSQHANYLERYYTTNLSYSGVGTPTALALDCASAQQTGANYSYSYPASPSSTAYVVQAVPTTVQSARDGQCGTLSLDQSGVRRISSTTVTLAQCW